MSSESYLHGVVQGKRWRLHQILAYCYIGLAE